MFLIMSCITQMKQFHLTTWYKWNKVNIYLFSVWLKHIFTIWWLCRRCGFLKEDFKPRDCGYKRGRQRSDYVCETNFPLSWRDGREKGCDRGIERGKSEGGWDRGLNSVFSAHLSYKLSIASTFHVATCQHHITNTVPYYNN